jgi:6-phosphogluconolactonase/glucosamine-6-phosphate isomerase/deaminase
VEVVLTDGPAEAAARAAQFVAKRIRPAVRRRGRFSLAVSGGSTPAAMFAALAATPDVPWGAVHVYQVDERVAPSHDPARNAEQLGVFPIPSENLHLMEVTWGDTGLAVASYKAGLPDRFDLVHLGIGTDGHTASWPPGDAEVVASPASVAMVGLFNGFRRMTLTPVAVNAARARLVLATGADKAEVIADWVAGRSALPIARVKSVGTTLVTDQGTSVRGDGPDHDDT